MKPRDWFGIAVRLLGLYFMFTAMNSSYYIFVKFLDFETAFKSPTSLNIVTMLYSLIAAWAILRKANKIVEFTYGSSEEG